LVEGEFRKEEIIFAGSVEVEGGAEARANKLMGLLEAVMSWILFEGVHRPTRRETVSI